MLISSKFKIMKTFCIAESKRLAFALATLTVLLAVLSPRVVRGDVPTGNAQSATNYFRGLATTLSFSTPDQIFETTLDDVATYLGYAGITEADLQNLDPQILMNPQALLTSANLQNAASVISNLGAVPFHSDDVLSTRFFAPKIVDIRAPEATRKLGWRKLVRLRARPNSPAQSKHITAAIILFNFFTDPGVTPFSGTIDSINTQVMLVTEQSKVATPGDDSGMDALYWLDYGALSAGGKLSLALNASFDANELPQTNNDVRPYFVPEGCVACHGINKTGPLINYLDTDHWFDRLDTDFKALKASGIPVIFDAQTNDTNSVAFKFAFDVIRRFNAEADEEVGRVQPKHDEALASRKWLELHGGSNGHNFPIDRAIGTAPKWLADTPGDAAALDALNTYCFRCHGTVKFSVFNRQELRSLQLRGMLLEVLQTNAPVAIKMPPARPLPDDARKAIIDFVHQQEGK
jgi:hypothetical protein